ncbi:hypothetical protein ACSSS7_001276 [Eimeria intestinalis]
MHAAPKLQRGGLHQHRQQRLTQSLTQRGWTGILRRQAVGRDRSIKQTQLQHPSSNSNSSSSGSNSSNNSSSNTRNSSSSNNSSTNSSSNISDSSKTAAAAAAAGITAAAPHKETQERPARREARSKRKR